MRPYFLAILVVATLTAQSDGQDFDPMASPVRHEAFWGPITAAQAGQPFESRVIVAPKEAIDYMKAMNAAQGETEVPSAAAIPADYEADFRAAMAGLPEIVKKKVSQKLKAVLLTQDVGSTGFSDIVLDQQLAAVGAFMFIDVKRTDLKANAWATMKEASPFKPDPDETLTAEIEDPANDTRANAIQYILLHELGHVISIGEKFHPRWDSRISSSTKAADYPFFALSWSAKPEGGPKSRYAADFADLPRIRFYHQDSSQLSSAKMEDVYGRLEKTNFATLYGETNPFDDFAEAFVSYVHTVMMGRPYRIKISKAGRLVKTYGPCWKEARCAEKRKILEDLLR